MRRARSPCTAKPIAAGALAALLGACAAGPDYHAPAPPSAAAYTPTPPPAQAPAAAEAGDSVQRFVAAEAPAAQWWRAFGSPELDALVQEALEKSPTLAQARQRLEQARQDYLAQSGATEWPQLNATLGVTRQKVNPQAFIGGAGGLGAGNVPPFTLYNAQVNVSYTLDLFGANRRELEALAAGVDYQQYELEAARLTLAGNVVTTTVRRASLARQVALTEELLANQERQLGITGHRFEAGGVSRQDLLAARSQVEETRAGLAPLRTQLSHADHQLAVYLGREPGDFAPGQGGAPGAPGLDSLAVPADVPLTLPATLAEQRPDIRAAEALLHEASARLGVATANLYPQITLSASTGQLGLSLSDLVNVWSIGANLTQPLFRGGELKARQRSAQAAYEAALGAYRQTVLEGLEQVADSLRALEQDALESRARDQARHDAHVSAEIAGRRHAVGGISQLGLLEAQRQDLQTSLEQAESQALRLADTAALFQALGSRP